MPKFTSSSILCLAEYDYQLKCHCRVQSVTGILPSGNVIFCLSSFIKLSPIYTCAPDMSEEKNKSKWRRLQVVRPCCVKTHPVKRWSVDHPYYTILNLLLKKHHRMKRFYWLLFSHVVCVFIKDTRHYW